MTPEIIIVFLYIVALMVAAVKNSDKFITALWCTVAMTFHVVLAANVDSFLTDYTAWQYYFIASVINSVLFFLVYKSVSNKVILYSIAALTVIPYLSSLDTYLYGISGGVLSGVLEMVYTLLIPTSHAILLFSLFSNNSNKSKPNVTVYTRGVEQPKYIPASVARDSKLVHFIHRD